MSSSNGAWAARIPDVRARVDIGDAAWGVANTVGAAVNLLAMAVVITILIGRVAPRRLAIVGAAGNLLVMPIVAASTSTTAPIVGICAWFSASCLMGIPMGALQLGVQRRYGRPIMGSFNACFGIGTFAGAGVGTIAASADISADRQFIGTSLLLLAILAGTGRWLPEESALGTVRKRRLRHRFTRQLRAAALLAGLAQFVTTTVELWTATYTHHRLATESGNDGHRAHCGVISD